MNGNLNALKTMVIMGASLPGQGAIVKLKPVLELGQYPLSRGTTENSPAFSSRVPNLHNTLKSRRDGDRDG